MPASTRRRTSSRSTCRRPWRRCACRPTRDYAWPPALGALYQRNGLTRRAGAGRRAGAVPGAGRGAERARCWHEPLAGNFYACFRTTCWSGCSAPVFAVRRAGARHGRARASGATSRRRARLSRERARRPRRRATCCASSTSTAATAKAATTRTTLHAVAPALPPLHLLRLHAVLRRHQRGDALPLPARPGRRPMRSPACRCCWAWSAASAC